MPNAVVRLKPKQMNATTVVDNPGVDTLIPTEKAVRDVIGAAFTPIMHSQLLMTIDGVYLQAYHQGIKQFKFRLNDVEAGATIEEIYVQLGTAPVGGALRVDIHKNGATIHSGTTYIELAAGFAAVSRTTDFAGAGAIAKNDYFQLELVQGNGSAADLIVHMRYYWAMI